MIINSALDWKLKMKSRSLIIIALVLAFLLVAVLVAWMFIHSGDYTLTEKDFTRSALVVVETNSNLKLPDKSRGLNMVYIASRGGPVFVAKIEIPADAEDAIKRQIAMVANEDYHPINALSEGVSWWNPEKASVVVERKYTVANSYVHVFLCRDDKQLVLFVESMYL